MDLNKKIENQSAGIAIIGLGYVGLPLAITFVDSGSTVIGLDIDIKKIDSLKNSKSYINHISNQSIRKMNDSNLFNRAKMDADPIIDSKDYKEESIRRIWENKKLSTQN